MDPTDDSITCAIEIHEAHQQVTTRTEHPGDANAAGAPQSVESVIKLQRSLIDNKRVEATIEHVQLELREEEQKARFKCLIIFTPAVVLSLTRVARAAHLFTLQQSHLLGVRLHPQLRITVWA